MIKVICYGSDAWIAINVRIEGKLVASWKLHKKFLPTGVDLSKVNTKMKNGRSVSVFFSLWVVALLATVTGTQIKSL